MDDPAFAIEVDDTTQLILLHASNHDLPALKPLLRIPGNASVQDSETGYTPLHAAIAACGPAISTPPPTSVNGTDSGNEIEEEVDMEKAKATVQELFMSGAIWNDLDASGETPGCLAWRLGRKELYQMCVEAGVRAEMLLGLMGGYEALESDDEEGEEIENMVQSKSLTWEKRRTKRATISGHDFQGRLQHFTRWQKLWRNQPTKVYKVKVKAKAAHEQPGKKLPRRLPVNGLTTVSEKLQDSDTDVPSDEGITTPLLLYSD